MKVSSERARRETDSLLAGARMLVLLVEEDSAVRALVERVLDAEGYDVLSAANSDQALAIVEDERQVDLLLINREASSSSDRQLSAKVRKSVVLQKPFTRHSLAAQVREALSGDTTVRPPMRILLVDDEPGTVLAMKLNLEQHHYDIACAEDGEEALRSIEQRMPDLIICDYRMPKMDGLELVARVRSTPETAAIPVILLTAKAFELDAREIRKQFGVEAVLPKPFSPRELLRLTERLLAAKVAVLRTDLDSDGSKTFGAGGFGSASGLA
jgi:CheY-like chemotaxis protein